VSDSSSLTKLQNSYFYGLSLLSFIQNIFYFCFVIAVGAAAPAIMYIKQLHISVNNKYTNNQYYKFSKEAKFIQILTFLSKFDSNIT